MPAIATPDSLSFYTERTGLAQRLKAMKANIYLHIGLHKTGTSSIQATLFNNRKKLLAHGINYLPLSENHSITLYPLFIEAPHRYRPNRIAGIDTQEKAAKKNAATEAALRRALEANSCGSIVISGEDLSTLPAAGLQQLKDMLTPYAARCRVIVYVRDPYATVTSIVQQRLRRGQTYEQICRRPPRPGYSRISASIEVFGRENVDVRIFDKAHFVNGDLIADFLAAIDADPEVAKRLDVERANIGLSHEAAYLLQAINEDRLAQGFAPRHDIVRWLAKIPGQPYRCPPEFFAAAQPVIAEELQWLRGLLGKDVFPDRPSLSATTPYWQEETLMAIALMLDDLVKRTGPKDRGVMPWFNTILRRFAPARLRR